MQKTNIKRVHEYVELGKEYDPLGIEQEIKIRSFWQMIYTKKKKQNLSKRTRRIKFPGNLKYK